jgi:hypothetical protein
MLNNLITSFSQLTEEFEAGEPFTLEIGGYQALGADFWLTVNG